MHQTPIGVNADITRNLNIFSRHWKKYTKFYEVCYEKYFGFRELSNIRRCTVVLFQSNILIIYTSPTGSWNMVGDAKISLKKSHTPVEIGVVMYRVKY